MVLPSFDRGGSESYCLRLINFSKERKIDWHVTSGNLRNAQLHPEFVKAGAKVYQESAGRIDIRQGLAFKRFLQQQRFDVVMTLTGLFGAEALKLARAAKVPCRIAWHRRSTPAFSPSFSRKLYTRWSLWELERSSDWILSNSETALDRFHGSRWRDQTRFRVIPNGVDPERFQLQPSIRKEVRDAHGLPESALVVGHIGRFDPAKDHETLLRTVRTARDSGQNAWLLCAGTGTDTMEFRNRVNAQGIADYTRCLGARAEVDRLYQAMDVFLFPSVTEGQPNALIEAMLSGVRILASDIPPIREAMPEFLHGHLFSPGDAEEATRLLIENVDSGPDKIARAREWAIDRYDPKRNFNAVLEIMGC